MKSVECLTEGAPRFEPGTSRSAVECSTTELYPLLLSPQTCVILNFSVNYFEIEISWDEMGERDIPAMMSYILQVNGEPKLSYIGHSLGCALFFIAMIQRPQWNQKIDVMLALAPVSSMRHFRSPLKGLAKYSSQIKVRQFHSFNRFDQRF